MEMLLLVFLAPVVLLPAVIAWWSRKRDRVVIIIFNVVFIPTAMYLVGAVFPAYTLRIPVVAALLTLAGLMAVWLVLLHTAIRKDVPGEAEIDEDVTLVDYDAGWPAAFAAERRRIADVLSLPPESIEHIGSTAVPGLRAKPVVDMMLGVAALPPLPEIPSRLRILGYENLGEAGVPGRVYLRLRGAEGAFNLHVLERGGEHWANNLALRELLRADPQARERYAAAKAAALESGGARLLAYSAAKAPALTQLISLARPAAVKDA